MSRVESTLRTRELLSLLVAGVAFLMYLRTLAPGALPGDSGEFQFAAWGWTLAHPTGYPLYLLIGGLWQHLLPFGDPAYRLNLLSAVFSSLAIGLAFKVFHFLSHNRGAALVAALAFAVSPTFWSQATEAEVYPLNTLFVVLLVYLALLWARDREFKYAAAWAIVSGLALAHHRTVLLLFPAFAVFLLAVRYTSDRNTFSPRIDKNSLRNVFPLLLLAMLPLSLYLYVPLRASATPYVALQVSPTQSISTFDNSPAGWASYIAGRSFENELRLDGESVSAIMAIPGRLLEEFNVLGVVLGIVGVFALVYPRRMSIVPLSFLGFAAILLFNTSYHIGDISDFYTPAYFLFAIWIACGLALSLDFLFERTRQMWMVVPTAALLIVTALLPAWNFASHLGRNDRSSETEWRTRWDTILAAGLPNGSILISNDRDEVTPLWYIQQVERMRTDILGLFPQVSPQPAFSNTTRLIESVYGSGRPIFLIKNMPGLAIKYELASYAPGLYRIVAPIEIGPIAKSTLTIGDLRVIGFRILSGEARRNSAFSLAVYLQPIAPLRRDYAASLQIFDDRGDKIAQGDDHTPGGGIYPSSLWQPGEILMDEFKVTLPGNVEPAVYHLKLKLYSETDDSMGDLTEIGKLRVGE